MSNTQTFTDLYAEVQHFYAKQVQLLDSRAFDEYAATYTEDAEFQHSPGVPPAVTRTAILAELHRFHERFEADPVQRRHWFNGFVLEPQEDGSVRSTFYALIVHVRPGVREPEIGPSCVVHDVLVWSDGVLLTRSRRVDHDHAA
ncbi:nuclear transport factor 2 family protein [Kutzneria buriramensis]|uniref:Actinorhodin biosynthesis protein ActVIA n=1 Tax=Kutzneria buriramensis TaxID=1045776 RepID=A0A3E0GX48_9PSEU|nr:nuclear transport factor 2 family protein [Kutzneria buriramensis]REH32547.1 actinorhodin biosynthesis protein ActVIA [Kutzneria buriramensis]